MNSSVYGSSLMVHACANDSQILPATSDAMFIYTILLHYVCYFASLNATNTFPNSDRPKQCQTLLNADTPAYYDRPKTSQTHNTGTAL